MKTSTSKPLRRIAGALLAAAAGLAPPAAPAQTALYKDAAVNPAIVPSGSSGFQLVALTGNDLRFKTFDSATGQWSTWSMAAYAPRAVPTGYNVNLPDSGRMPMVTWPDGANWRSNAFYTGTPGAGEPSTPNGGPWWTNASTNFTFDVHSTPNDVDGNLFAVANGFARRDLNLQTYLHFFGNTSNDRNCWVTGLREKWWDADIQAWRFAYHGCPSSDLAMDTGSAGSTHRPYGSSGYSRSFVFSVGFNRSSGVGRVYARWVATGTRAQPWAWVDLGVPPGAAISTRGPTPVAVSRDRGNDIWRTHVFMPARSQADGLFHLYERFWDDATGWSAWSDHGHPAWTAADKTDATGTFQMTGADLVGRNQSLRISLQGHSWTPGKASGRLVEHLWDGTSWVWMPTETSTDRDANGNPLPLRVKSVAMSTTRTVAVAVSSTGKLWERSRDSGGRVTWTQH